MCNVTALYWQHPGEDVGVALLVSNRVAEFTCANSGNDGFRRFKFRLSLRLVTLKNA